MRRRFITKIGCIMAILMALTITGCNNWSRTYGLGAFICVEQTNDGGYVAGGWQKIIKFNAQGNPLWQKALNDGDSDTTSWGSIIHQTRDNGYIAVETIESSSPVGPGFFYGCVLIKLNAHGKKEWGHSVLNPNGEKMQVSSVEQTSDDGYILSGSYTDTNGVTSGVLVRINSSGIILWKKVFEGYTFNAWENPTGGYSLVGSIPIDSDNWETMIVETDMNGIEVWRKTYEDTAAYAGTVNADGTAVLAVEDRDTGDVSILKIDAEGNVTWKQTYAHTGETDGMGCILSVEQTTDDGYVIAGIRSLDGWADEGAWIVRTDQEGNETGRWSNEFSTAYDYVSQVRPTLDGGYIIAGCILPKAMPVNQAWLAKTDANGKTSGWSLSSLF